MDISIFRKFFYAPLVLKFDVPKRLSKGNFVGTLIWFKTFKGELDQLIIRDSKYQNRKYGIFIIFEQLIKRNFQWLVLNAENIWNNMYSRVNDRSLLTRPNDENGGTFRCNL